MTIWVDADALPRAAREILVRASTRREVDTVFVANQWQPQPKSERATIVTVSAGSDVADDYIVEHCETGDLCITSDVPLAARLVENGVTVITTYGKELTEENVREALSLRDFHDELRTFGVQTSGPPPYDDVTRQRFANALDRWITKHG